MVDGVLIYQGRSMVPTALREEVLATLHSGHQGVTNMWGRVASSVWWPGLYDNIARVRARCWRCDRNAPSQPKEPPKPLLSVKYPFQKICSDYFSLEGRHYLVPIDRYSGWPSVHRAKTANNTELIRLLRNHYETFGVPEELTSDGGSAYVSCRTQQFLQTWGIAHRVSLAYTPHGNLRAETGVKSMKRLLQGNIGPNGDLDTDAFCRALLNYRNTPDRDTGRSPAQVFFGRVLRDMLHVSKGSYKPHKEWLLLQDKREQVLAKRHMVSEEAWSRTTHTLTPLAVGTVVSVQNQRGVNKMKWDNSCVVVDCLPFSQYKVKLDGTGRIMLRNRVALRRIIPYGQIIKDGPRIERPDAVEVKLDPSPSTPELPVVPMEDVTKVEVEETPPVTPAPANVGPRRSLRVRKVPDRLGFA